MKINFYGMFIGFNIGMIFLIFTTYIFRTYFVLITKNIIKETFLTEKENIIIWSSFTFVSSVLSIFLNVCFIPVFIYLNKTGKLDLYAGMSMALVMFWCVVLFCVATIVSEHLLEDAE